MLLPKDFTKQEKIIANCLSKLGLRYTEQFNILKYTVDFWVPELSMVIEADGMMGHLRKADAIRDEALLETTEVDVKHVLHITATSPEPIMEEICQALDNL